jgi:hypothetical protein
LWKTGRFIVYVKIYSPISDRRFLEMNWLRRGAFDFLDKQRLLV